MIDSSQNKNIKLINALKAKKERDKNGLFVAEGLRFVEEIPMDYDVMFYAVSESFSTGLDMDSLAKRAEVHIVSDKLFKEISDTENPQGILAVIKQKKENILNIIENAGERGFFIIAEELNDPGNLGTIIRTADACNCDGIILTIGSVDIYNPKVLRSTMGSIFHVPIVYTPNIEKCIKLLKNNGICVYAAHLKGEEYPYSLDLKKGCGFLIGNEARGLADKTAAMADKYIKIPMPGKAESLNASVAAAVLMYEAVRQRL